MTSIYTFDKPNKYDDRFDYISSIEFYARNRRGKMYYGVILTMFKPSNNSFYDTSVRFNSKEEGREYFKKMKKELPGLRKIQTIDD